jgi:hypothetical protein
MKLGLAIFVAGALALAAVPATAMPAGADEAALQVPAVADKGASDADPKYKASCEEQAKKFQHDPRFDGEDVKPEKGKNVVDLYLKENGGGLVSTTDVRHKFAECRWRKSATAWLDDNGVECYFTPSYLYHAHSPAQWFKYDEKKAGCAGEPTRDGYAQKDGHTPEYLMSVPEMYFNNNYERRCSVRTMVKIPKTKKHDEHWALAWVVEHDVGPWTTKGLDNSPGATQQGILLSRDLYLQFLDEGQPDLGTLPHEVEWFFPDLNTI